MALFSRTEDEVAFIFDVGSGSIGGAMVRIHQASPPTLLYSVRLEFPPSPADGARRLVSRMLRTLSEVLLALVHEGLYVRRFSGAHQNVGRVLIILAAPWTVSQTRTLHLESERKFPVTRGVLTALLDEQRREQILPHASIRGSQELALLGETPLEARVDGYPTERPFGKRGRAVSFSVFSSFAPAHIKSKIGDTIAHAIGARPQMFYSFSLAMFVVARDLFPASEDFLCVDLGNEQTEVGITKRGVMVEVTTFPFGRNQVIRALDAAGNIGVETSAAFLKLFAEEKGMGPRYGRGLSAFRSATSLWQDGFKRVLISFSHQWFLPRHIFLTADDDIISVISEFIPAAGSETAALLGAPLELTVFDSAALRPYLTASPSVSPDPFLSLESVFASRLLAAAHSFGVIREKR